MRRTVLLLTLLTAAAAPSSASALTIYGAASLRDVLPRIDGRPTFSFGGSNTLARQIGQGARADLFLAASPREPRALARQGRCERTVLFATNSLVMIVPKRNRANIRSVHDLNRGSAKRVALGSEGVPIGFYTRRALDRLRLSGVLRRNRVSTEPNVNSIVSKVALGSADAGFVYLSDFRAARKRLAAVNLPRSAQPPIRYELCVVKRRGVDRRGAIAFARQVLSARGRRLLTDAGFGVPRR